MMYEREDEAKTKGTKRLTRRDVRTVSGKESEHKDKDIFARECGYGYEMEMI